MLHLGFKTTLFLPHKTFFPIIIWMLGIYVENSSGEPLTVFDRAVNSVQSQYAMCAICLCWIRRQETVRVPSLSNEHLALHADASAQCSTALQTLGGYAGNTWGVRQTSRNSIEQSTGQATTVVFVCTHVFHGWCDVTKMVMVAFPADIFISPQNSPKFMKKKN